MTADITVGSDQGHVRVLLRRQELREVEGGQEFGQTAVGQGLSGHEGHAIHGHDDLGFAAVEVLRIRMMMMVIRMRMKMREARAQIQESQSVQPRRLGTRPGTQSEVIKVDGLGLLLGCYCDFIELVDLLVAAVNSSQM